MITEEISRRRSCWNAGGPHHALARSGYSKSILPGLLQSFSPLSFRPPCCELESHHRSALYWVKIYSEPLDANHLSLVLVISAISDQTSFRHSRNNGQLSSSLPRLAHSVITLSSTLDQRKHRHGHVLGWVRSVYFISYLESIGSHLTNREL